MFPGGQLASQNLTAYGILAKQHDFIYLRWGSKPKSAGLISPGMSPTP